MDKGKKKKNAGQGQRQSMISEFFQKKKCKSLQCGVKDSSKDEELIQCEICEDAFHWFCVEEFKQKPRDSQEFMC